MIEGGRFNRISVAVVVDGNYTKNDKGELAYEPRSKEEIDRIAALVRTAIGFDAKRGDQVEVANLRLAETPSVPMAEPAGWMSFLQFTKDDAMRGIELGVMALLGAAGAVLLRAPAAAARDRRRQSPQRRGPGGVPVGANPWRLLAVGSDACRQRRQRKGRQRQHHPAARRAAGDAARRTAPRR